MGDLDIFFNYPKAIFFYRVYSWRRYWLEVAAREIWSGHKEKNIHNENGKTLGLLKSQTLQFCKDPISIY